ncbi:MAG: YggS family pyridoxal phosphate-dependent enzyme [Magnetococcales bacterium]|nr:YggS family pyridoxal phosphate-dependent enzyme [Magnetococcales bacterium]MBF0113722.1 YggS family pyridoxal phosphate-dependent enzyme [Magnetococcales bacterium]
MELPITRLQQLQERIAAACQRCGRSPEQVRLLAVSKTQPVAKIAALAAAGQLHFGENRVQEARDKQLELLQQSSLHNNNQMPPLQWHLIGSLQRNKAKQAAGMFQMIHSVDSLALAQTLSAAVPQGTCLPILLQVNVGREAQKQGLLVEELLPVLQQVAQLPGLAVQGLMTIPPISASAAEARPFFRTLAQLAAQLAAEKLAGVTMHELSMGMSQDYAVAIEEGATWIRVGSALFGSR